MRYIAFAMCVVVSAGPAFAAPAQFNARLENSADVALVRSGSRSSGSGGSHSVRGYTTRNGTYVAPHRATNPDSSRGNNWSTRGNVNPNTGRAGTQDPYRP